jgi:hypothetical protein
MDTNQVEILCRQTNYTPEEAHESLLRNKTLEKAIQEYLGVVSKPESPVSVNQGIFKSIRTFIDNAS